MKELLSKQEGKTLEFKRELSSSNKEKVLQTIIAFVNGSGGNLIFGVDDNKNIVGVANPFELEERIANIVFDSISPTIRIDTVFITEDNKTLVIVKVPSGIETPYYLKSKGMEQGTYIRIGSTTRIASKEIIKSLQLRGENISYDSQIDYRFTKDDMDFFKMKKVFKDQKDVEIKEDHIFMFNLLAKSDEKVYPTVAGMLLFPKKEYIEYDYAKIKCAHFKGNSPNIFIDKAEFRGSIIEQIESTMKFIKSNIKLSAEIGDVYRKERYEYPISALREAVVNAVTHRDYILKGQDIKVAIFDNRIEISSPGELPAGFSVEDIGKIDFSKLRNITIGRIFSELKIIEQWGRGFASIIESCKKYGNIEPKFREELSNFKVIFRKKAKAIDKNNLQNVTSMSPECHHLTPVVTSIDDISEKKFARISKVERQTIITEIIRKGIKFKSKQLETIFGVKSRTIKRDLKELKDRNIIEYIGDNITGFYQLKRVLD